MLGFRGRSIALICHKWRLSKEKGTRDEVFARVGDGFQD